MSKPRASRSEPLDYGALSSFIGFQVRKAQLTIYEDFMRNAPVRGLTPGQLAILIFVEKNPGMTQQRLCDGIRIEKSTLVVRLHRLADRGLLERERSSLDRRQNSLKLTKQGSQALKSMLAFVAKHERRLSARLSAAERKQLLELLQKVG